MSDSRIRTICLLLPLAFSLPTAHAQGTIPTFKRAIGGSTYTLAGRDPAQEGATVIPTVLVPVTLTFDGKAARMDASKDVPRILKSPVFSRFAFSAGNTQYADALLRATFPAEQAGHTLLGKPEIKPVTVAVPVGYGYLLTSKKSGTAFAVVDSEFLQKEIFKQIPRQDGKLVLAVTHNTTYYAAADATVCCTWGTHGVDAATGNSFVLGSYLGAAPAIVTDRDIQPLTQQLAEFFNDPLHDPLIYYRTDAAPGNYFPSWLHPLAPPSDEGRCGGSGIGTNYFLLEPTNTNPKNSFPASSAFAARTGTFTYHLQNVALLPWYLGRSAPPASVYSFPDPHVLSAAAQPCPDSHQANRPEPTATPAPSSGVSNGHQLIGYWTGSRFNGNTPFPLHDVPPQWDVILAAFASPDKSAPEGTLRFRPPQGIEPDQLKADIATLKGQGKKVMISLGGGGEYFKLDDAHDIPNFVSSVTSIVSEYGFEGVDIDFETPSLVLAPGDTDFRHPTTPSIVNLITGLRQLRQHFGPGFMISLVPEGSQIPGGYPGYGGQFGSYLPLAYGLRDILSFLDVQDYNTPPLEGLDGEIYQSSSVDYHAAMTELLLHGFNVGGDPAHFFPPMPPNQVAIGFLTGYSDPTVVSHAMDYIITAKAPAGTTYKLRKPSGYPALIGAMFWTIDDDRRDNYTYSNLIGPQLHGYPASK
ncbi:MAG TPA: glycosyl hydrolase family 18 protein [Acidobacteriaceae bacterium]|nr:glycosyl hydrolase family 18 protein [Acidobacteriaceae bacterium]